jgi:hypothetical protein
VPAVTPAKEHMQPWHEGGVWQVSCSGIGVVGPLVMIAALVAGGLIRATRNRWECAAPRLFGASCRRPQARRLAMHRRPAMQCTDTCLCCEGPVTRPQQQVCHGGESSGSHSTRMLVSDLHIPLECGTCQGQGAALTVQADQISCSFCLRKLKSQYSYFQFINELN